MQKITISQADLNDVALQLPRGALAKDAIYDSVAGTLTCSDAIASLIATVDRSGLAAARIRQVAALRAACAAQIAKGVASGALGAPHTYPTDTTSQHNLLADVVASLNAPAGWSASLWCEDANGAWTFVAHTAAQVQQAGADVRAAIAAARARLTMLTAQVNAAPAPALIAQVVW